jgi:hypothetical protein
LFATGVDDNFAELFDLATDMDVSGETGRMLVGKIVKEEALYFVIDGKQEDGALCSILEAHSIVESTRDISDILQNLTLLKAKKGIA